ncbi:Uncharacterised protein [Chlamydia trachomatis]|nr:Uncharacterised protein [Chlamydia trachomatis]
MLTAFQKRIWLTLRKALCLLALGTRLSALLRLAILKTRKQRVCLGLTLKTAKITKLMASRKQPARTPPAKAPSPSAQISGRMMASIGLRLGFTTQMALLRMIKIQSTRITLSTQKWRLLDQILALAICMLTCTSTLTIQRIIPIPIKAESTPQITLRMLTTRLALLLCAESAC